MLRKPALIASLGLFAALAGTAQAQPDAEDKTFERAGHIASQPVRDVGLSKDKIPPVLQNAFDMPYVAPARGCGALVAELTELNAVLGRDFDDVPAKGDDKATQIAQAGGEMLVNSLIPFRGLVREVSGAAGAERRRLAAVNAGLARRGFLRGLARERRCKLPPAPPPKAEKQEKKEEAERKDGDGK